MCVCVCVCSYVQIHAIFDFQPYGSVLPGATVAFSTSDRNGNKERSVGKSSQWVWLLLP